MGEDKGKKETIKVNVTGMHCTSCAMNIENKLKEKEGINQANVSYSTGQANIEYSPEKIDKKEILDSIEESGYKGFFIHEEEAEYATDPITGIGGNRCSVGTCLPPADRRQSRHAWPRFWAGPGFG